MAMNFNDFLKDELENDPELKREYDALALEYVNVVRCKDCKHWKHEEDVDFVCTRHYGYRLSTDFCSYGERKEQT